MPIVIKNVDWSQTQNMVTLKVPLNGVHHSKADIFCTKLYIKASFEQYFFEVFLMQPIAPKASNCTFTQTHIIFELVKCESVMWDALEMVLPKNERQKLKLQYIEEEHKRTQNEAEETRNKKSELKRLAVREQMSLDAKQHELIERIKNKEKENALKEMKIWKSGKPTRPRPKAVDAKPIPAPRNAATLNVEFTPREFPTPCRESRMDEENEWLRKQAEAQRSVGFISDDLRPEEHNPQFLKHKGDEFMRSRNFLAAVSAYSFGIKLNQKFCDLYVGRAEAHLALGNFNKTVQDCSSALDLMKPEVPQNVKSRALCIGRRGLALVNLGLVQQGIDELKASLRLEPNEFFSSKLLEASDSIEQTA